MPAQLFLNKAPRDLGGWLALLEQYAALPVLASTAEALEELRLNEDAVDAHMLAGAIVDDPLMTVKLLAHVAQLRRGREGSDTETVTEALVMLGIPPFFRAFGPQATVEERLADHPDALDGFLRVLQRSRRAARFAMGFAVHRMDHDAPVIHEAALLHDLAELLLWTHAPALALQIQQRQADDASLRSSAVQRELLHVDLGELQQALMQAWRLPSLLVQISDDHGTQRNAQLRNVQLAVRIARHSTADWHNAALPDDVRELGELLTILPDAALRLVQEIDDDS